MQLSINWVNIELSSSIMGRCQSIYIFYVYMHKDKPARNRS